MFASRKAIGLCTRLCREATRAQFAWRNVAAGMLVQCDHDHVDGKDRHDSSGGAVGCIHGCIVGLCRWTVCMAVSEGGPWMKMKAFSSLYSCSDTVTV